MSVPSRARITPVVLGLSLAAGACATVRGSGARDLEGLDRVEIARCRVENTAVPITASMVQGLAGAYRLYMTADGSAELASGDLELAATAVATDERAPRLVGTADIDASRVGATVPGDPRSKAATAPGAAVYLFADPTAAGAPRVVIRLGSESNRLDEQRFDGAHTTLRITSMSAARFGGVWSSAVGASETGGDFCATRA